MERENEFRDVITGEEELRDLLGYPSEVVARKAIGSLDDHCRDYIAKSPFLLVSTSDSEGRCDVSPRGDAPGFVLVLDGQRLVIPERPGNRRADSLRNIISNPQIGLIFLIPGLEETLRVNGRAYVTRDEELLQRMQAMGKSPQLGIGVVVEECYMHCAKAFKRSQLWRPESWLGRERLPVPARILAAHTGRDEQSIAQGLVESYTQRLY
ncbi:Pyridoxamine 5'-phosphate oxidase [Paenibacillus konkukensis]|uniref:Pyridoxamine 5'-phosphate oxidase n=1 Tax=Paenibacillus konkukensis TaxID=2020716 RepID=A0ABY4RI89_9BACL|nr:pyridoxamine 5'-phosphate oxidase family protein [Paenibacillus konkukensis]UQZ81566.1 Pyridoxamine 5'-phosphate oxidase [Paenibacillus konkukensis]